MRSAFLKIVPVVIVMGALFGAACAEDEPKNTGKGALKGDCTKLGEADNCDKGKICAEQGGKNYCLKECDAANDCTELQECKKQGDGKKACVTKGT